MTLPGLALELNEVPAIIYYMCTLWYPLFTGTQTHQVNH